MFVFVVFLVTTDAATSPGPAGTTIETTTVNPCFTMYGCLNGADCPNGNCVCKTGFSGTTCAQSALTALNSQISLQLSSADLAKAAEFAEEAQLMMDNQLAVSYTDIKASVTTTNTITEKLLTIIEGDSELADNAVVDLSDLTEDITEMTTDVLQGTKQAQSAMTPDELETAVFSAEENLINMVNLMLDKRTESNTSASAIDTEQVSLRVVKAKERDVPMHYNGRDAGFSLPYFETFQDKNRKKNISINVLAYPESPYLHVGNPEEVGSSVIKLHVLDKKGKEEKDIKDKDDPVDVFVNTKTLDSGGNFNDMTESLADSGVYMSYVDTNQTAGGFMMEVKLTSLKICDTYGRYESYPDEDNFDMWVKTKGKSKIIDRHPLDLRLAFKNQILKITLSPGKNGKLDPLVFTASCEDDRQDTERRRKRATGISLVRHQFRTGLLNVKTLKDGDKNWTFSDKIENLGAEDGKIQFKSHFFGTFSANMFFIGPSPIDFSKLFANVAASLENSPYALSAIVAIIIIFVVLTIPLQRRDRQDEIMWSYYPLLDNPHGCSIVYYVIVETAVTSTKVMTSSVYMNLIGKDCSSGTRKLDDGQRKNFRRGTSSHFEVHLNKNLGDLQTLQIWHDNIDGKTAWHLRKVTVVKADTGERYTFLCGKWLSLNCEDGRTWRSLEVLDDTSVETDVLFYNLSQRKLFDDHLWVSLFKRPQFSRFTRVQRLWCLCALLFLAMIASAMWYDTPDNSKMQTIQLGPLKLNYKQIYVGMMSAMIALIPSVVLVLIFRNRKFKGEQCKGCHVPWWFIFLAYFLVFLCVGASGTFVFLYSLEWGGTKSLEWMVSFVLSIFQSVMIVEPVKAILVAILIACLFKKMGSKELSDKSMPVPDGRTITENEEKVDMEKMEEGSAATIVYPDFPGSEKESAELMVARQRAQIDKQLWTKMKLWLGILLYVVLVAFICSHSDVSTAFQQNDHILSTLSTVYVPNSTDEIYDYIRTTFNRAVYPIWWETEDDELLRPAYIQRFIYNAYNFRLTTSRLRQVRVSGNCSEPEVMRDTVDTCVDSFNDENEETRHFCTFWWEYNETTCFDENEEFHLSFLYSNEGESAGDLTYTGQHGTYGPAGYFIDLGPKQSLVTKYVDLLQNNGWLDYRTRAVFLDVVTYNANTRLFSHIKIVFEIPSVGSVKMQKVVWSANLYPYVYPLDFLVLFLQIIFIIVLCVRFVLWIVHLYRLKKRAFKSVSTYLRFLELCFGFAAVVCCILRIDSTILAIATLKKSIGRYVSFELVRLYDAAYQGCLAAVLFIITLDLLKPLEFNYHFFMLISSLKIARGALFTFMIIIFMEVTAFSALLYLTIGSTHELFRTFGESLYTLWLALLGMMKYDSEHFNDTLMKFYIGLYTMTTTITLVNVFIVLLNISFNDVKAGLGEGTLHFDWRLNSHFWYKVDKTIQWILDKMCLKFPKIRKSKLERLQDCIERLKRVSKQMNKNDLVRHKLTAKLMLKMMEIDSRRSQLQCLNEQRNQFTTKYIFGFSKTGETMVILTVPTQSCPVTISVQCFIEQRLRRDVVKTFENKHVGKSFTFTTTDNNRLKGSVIVEIIDKDNPNSGYNMIVAKWSEDSTWQKSLGIKTKSGVMSSFVQIPFQFAAMKDDTVPSNLHWGLLERYQIPINGGTVFPSYDPETKVLLPENTFSEDSNIYLRSKLDEASTILNVITECPVEKPIQIHLPKNPNSKQKHQKENNPEFIIVARNGEDMEWASFNSALQTEEGNFMFTYSRPKAWSHLEVTVKKSCIFWDSTLSTHYETNLIKAIVMVSKIKDIARCWQKMAELLHIKEEKIKQLKESYLCHEEKCFMVIKEWLESTEVSFKMLTSLLTALGFRVVAEQIRKKWIINAPASLKTKDTEEQFLKRLEQRHSSTTSRSTVSIGSIDITK